MRRKRSTMGHRRKSALSDRGSWKGSTQPCGQASGAVVQGQGGQENPPMPDPLSRRMTRRNEAVANRPIGHNAADNELPLLPHLRLEPQPRRLAAKIRRGRVLSDEALEIAPLHVGPRRVGPANSKSPLATARGAPMGPRTVLVAVWASFPIPTASAGLVARRESRP